MVEVLLEVMEKEVRDPKEENTAQWGRLFGTKDSAVVNLQKLVHLLGELHVQAGDAGQEQKTLAPIDPQEMAMLVQWLKETNESRGGPEAAR